jgi:hypothetical protein
MILISYAIDKCASGLAFMCVLEGHPPLPSSYLCERKSQGGLPCRRHASHATRLCEQVMGHLGKSLKSWPTSYDALLPRRLTKEVVM